MILDIADKDRIWLVESLQRHFAVAWERMPQDKEAEDVLSDLQSAIVGTLLSPAELESLDWITLALLGKVLFE